MIFGIGTDITDSNRFLSLFENQRFIKRILTKTEQSMFFESKNKSNFLAKRFAAKEAFSKALGCGIGGKIFNTSYNFHSIEIIKTNLNAPLVNIIDLDLKKNLGQIFISFADEGAFVLSFIIIEKNK